MNRSRILARVDNMETPPIRVLVIGPAPGTLGGIGTMMDHLQMTQSLKSEVTFMDDGATGSRRMAAFFRALVWIVKNRSEYDLAHVNLSSKGSTYRKIIVSWMLRVAQRPYLIHLHGSEFREFYGRSWPPVRGLTRQMMRRAKKVLVLGRAWESFAIETLRCLPGNVIRLPNAVPGPSNLPDRPHSTGNIVFTGRIGKRKGIIEILQATQDMSDLKGWKLFLAGDVTDDSIKKLLKGAPESVSLLGWLSQEELHQLLAKSSIFVLPSHAEGLPLSLLDAMAWGLAPVVTTVGSIGDVVSDEEDALLVEPGSSESLQLALRQLIADPQLTERLGRAARRKWEESYSIEGYRGRLDKIYEASLRGQLSDV